MRRRRYASSVGLLLSAVLGLALAGCAGDEPRTELTLTAENAFVGEAVFRLDCDPPGGDLPDPKTACAALARNPELVTDPQPFTCFGGTFSWWDITIEGRLEGEDVGVSTSTCWTPQMALIEALGVGGSELEKHVDPLSRPAYPGSGIPRSALAETVEIPGDAPGWLIRTARLQARWLGDLTPERLLIVLGPKHRITLWGDFARPRSGGRVARIVVDPKRRTVDSLSLDGRPTTPGPTGSPSYVRGWEACLRAQRTDALPPFAQLLGRSSVGVAARRYASRMEQIVRAHINLRRGDSFRLAYTGCLDAAWPEEIPRRAISLRELVRGDRYLFPPGAIRPGAIVTCLSGGIRIKGSVPPAGRGHIRIADGMRESATVAIRTRTDGTVVASCD